MDGSSSNELLLSNGNSYENFSIEEDEGHENMTLNATESSSSFGISNFTLLFLYCSITAGTLIGNTLVIVAVATTTRLRTVTNCFVMSLAVADWLVGMFVMPPKVVQYLSNDEWNFGSLFCKVWIALDIMLCTSSILSLCTISIDRYLAITRPLAYSRRRRSKRLALSMISCVWVASIVITITPMFGWYNSNKQDGKICEYNDDKIYVIYSALGSFFLPLLVMLYVYARIACVIARRQTNIQKLHKLEEKKCCDSDDNGRAQVDEICVASLESENGTTSSFRRIEKMRERNIRRSHFFGIFKNNKKHLLSSRILPNARKKESSSYLRKWRILGKSSELNIISNPIIQRKKVGVKEEEKDLQLQTICKLINNGKNTEKKDGSKVTGSRLCNHSKTTSSPPNSIIHKIVKSNSSTSSTGAPSHSNLVPEEKCRHLDSEGGIWTVGDIHDLSLIGEKFISRSALNLTTNPSPKIIAQKSNTTSLNHSPLFTSNSYDDLSRLKHLKNSQIHFSSVKSTRSKLHPKSTSLLNKTKNNKNTKMNLQLVKSVNEGKSTVSTGRRITSIKRETKTAQTLAAVVGGFIICWLPFFVGYIITPFIGHSDILMELMGPFTWLGWSNSAINPFIYAFYSTDFRSAFYRLTVHKFNWIFKLNTKSSDQRMSPRRFCHIPQNNSGNQHHGNNGYDHDINQANKKISH